MTKPTISAMANIHLRQVVLTGFAAPDEKGSPLFIKTAKHPVESRGVKLLGFVPIQPHYRPPVTNKKTVPLRLAHRP